MSWAGIGKVVVWVLALVMLAAIQGAFERQAPKAMVDWVYGFVFWLIVAMPVTWLIWWRS